MSEIQTILIIEDDADISKLVALELEEAGFRALTAHDGVSGLTMARESNPDLVILDWVCPIWMAQRLRDGFAKLPTRQSLC
jgi:DNA-binding response OmpR family regulator